MSSFSVVPVGWEIKEIKDTGISVIDGDRGKQYPNKSEFSSTGFCLFLNTGNIKGDSFDFTSCDFITEQKDSLLKKGKLRRRDIILTTRGTVGSIAYYSESIPFEDVRINSGMVIMRAGEDLDSCYLYYLLKSPISKTQYLLYASGSAQPQLPIKDLRRIKLPLPPIKVQRKIAAILTAYDDLIEANKRRIALLEKMAEELYREWFVRLRFPGYQNTRFVKGVPEGAKVSPLREHIKHYIGGGWGADSPEGRENQPVYVIRGTDFDAVAVGDVTSVPLRYEKFSSVESRKLQPGDIVMENSVNHASRTSGKSILITEGILKLFDGDVICASFCKLLRPANHEFAKLLHLNFKMIFEQGLFEIYQNVATNGIANLQIERFLDRHQIVVPPNIDLAKINCLDVSVIARMQARLRATRDLLLPRLISGKLSVEDLDIQFPPSMQEDAAATLAEEETAHEARHA